MRNSWLIGFPFGRRAKPSWQFVLPAQRKYHSSFWVQRYKKKLNRANFLTIIFTEIQLIFISYLTAQQYVSNYTVITMLSHPNQTAFTP